MHAVACGQQFGIPSYELDHAEPVMPEDFMHPSEYWELYDILTKQAK